MKAFPRRAGTVSPGRRLVPIILAVSLLAPALPCSGLSIHLKLAGSYGRPALDGVNRALGSWADSLKAQATLTPGWGTTGGGEGRVRDAYGLEGEILIDLTRHFAVGVGSGYALAAASIEDTDIGIVRTIGSFDYARPTTVSMTPLFFSAYASFDLGRKLDVYIGTGGGRVRARYSASEATKRTQVAAFSYTNEQLATGWGNMTQAVAGFTFAHDASLGLFVEGGYRWAKVDDLRNGSGKLYAYEEFRPDLDLWQAKIALFENPPEGESFRSVGRAVVDGSGPVVKVGFLIKF